MLEYLVDWLGRRRASGLDTECSTPILEGAAKTNIAMTLTHKITSTEGALKLRCGDIARIFLSGPILGFEWLSCVGVTLTYKG